MRIGEYLKRQRLTKKLSIEELEERSGTEYSVLYDLEMNDDELNLLTISQLAKLCAVLDTKPQAVLQASLADTEHLPLFALLQARREEMGYSAEHLANRIGYETFIVEAIEGRGDTGDVCLDAVKRIAMELNIPLSLILAKL